MTTSFGLIIVGDEILSGKRQDKHLSKVIELLTARGLVLSYADYVGDDPERWSAPLPRATRCFRPAALALRPTTKPAKAPRVRWVCRCKTTPKPKR